MLIVSTPCTTNCATALPKERCSTAARRQLLFTCEHGGKRIPSRYLRLFVGHERLLESHRGYDRGALWLARRLARAFGAPLFAATTSRLLVDLNRSLHNRHVFSSVTRVLRRHERDDIVARHYVPHRYRVEQHVRALIDRHVQVVHLAIHSFTPRLAGRTRNADVGLLYDSRRPSERDFCVRWQAVLQSVAPHLHIRRNYPYRGSDDGFTTHLRCLYPAADYLGIELEINQRHVTKSSTVGHAIPRALTDTLRSAIGSEHVAGKLHTCD